MKQRHNDNEHESIGQVMRRLIDQSNWGPKVQQSEVQAAWQRLMGQQIAAQTRSVALRKKQLVISFRSDALRQELSYSKELIAKRMNEELRGELIAEVLLR